MINARKKMFVLIVFAVAIAGVVAIIVKSGFYITVSSETVLVKAPVRSPICKALWQGEPENVILELINSDPNLLLQLSRPVELFSEDEMTKIMRSGPIMRYPLVGPIEVRPLEYAIRLKKCDKIHVLFSVDRIYTTKYLVDMLKLAIELEAFECLTPFLEAVPVEESGEYLRMIINVLELNGIEI